MAAKSATYRIGVVVDMTVGAVGALVVAVGAVGKFNTRNSDEEN